MRSILFIGLFIATILSGSAYVHAAPLTNDQIERLIAQCGADGGTWDPATQVCVRESTIRGGLPESSSGCDDFNKSILGIPTWYKYLDGNASDCEPAVDGIEDALPIGLAVLEAGMTLGGLVAVVMVFVGGFKYVLSQGEPDKAAGGRKTVVNAMIGLVIVILATRIVSFIGSRLG